MGAMRVGGNRKGVFTRARQPKAGAHHLRARYQALAAADAGAPPPSPEYYVCDDQPAALSDDSSRPLADNFTDRFKGFKPPPLLSVVFDFGS